jgi:hypothetical protein
MKRPNVSQSSDRALWNETTQQERTVLRAVLRVLRNSDAAESFRVTIHAWDNYTKSHPRKEAATV